MVARRHRNPRLAWLPQVEFDRLAALRSQGLLVPEPSLADTGELLGMPALVVERLPGAPVIAPPDPYQWARLTAETLADIHAVDATSIPHVHDVRGEASIPDEWKRKVRAHPRGKEVLHRLAQFRPHTTTTPGLIHADYQSTNVIWSEGRISGVVDWVMPCYGDVAVDLAEARIDTLLLFGPDVAEAMRISYEDATGRGVAQMTSWDLYAVMSVGLAVGVKSWSARYRRLGRLDRTADVLSGRSTSGSNVCLRNARRRPDEPGPFGSIPPGRDFSHSRTPSLADDQLRVCGLLNRVGDLVGGQRAPNGAP